MYCTDTDFAFWAFGEDTWAKFMVLDADNHDLMYSWNERHGDLMCLEGHELTGAGGIIMETMDKLKKLWEQRNEEASK